jgi:hypothetical protein
MEKGHRKKYRRDVLDLNILHMSIIRSCSRAKIGKK